MIIGASFVLLQGQITRSLLDLRGHMTMMRIFVYKAVRLMFVYKSIQWTFVYKSLLLIVKVLAARDWRKTDINPSAHRRSKSTQSAPALTRDILPAVRPPSRRVWNNWQSSHHRNVQVVSAIMRPLRSRTLHYEAAKSEKRHWSTLRRVCWIS